MSKASAKAIRPRVLSGMSFLILSRIRPSPGRDAASALEAAPSAMD